jgi:Xaa-Pro aminopeptidase
LFAPFVLPSEQSWQFNEFPQKHPMRHHPVGSKLPTSNRRKLMGAMMPRSVAVVHANDISTTNADGTAAYYPNSDLFYLSAIEQEETILLLAPDALEPRDREILFIREPTPQSKLWDGHKLSKEEAASISGIERVEWISAFRGVFHFAMNEMDNVYLNLNEHARAVIEADNRDARFVRETQKQYPLHSYHRLARLLRIQRLVKSSDEVELIRKAAEITRDGFLSVAKLIRPGINECEVEAEFAREFIRRRGRFAFMPIVASGKNACSLHYIANDQPCRKGDLLLLDLAASYANYNADVTRTFPVSGKFSRRQRDVYKAVLRVMEESIRGLRPGKTPKQWHKEGQALMQEELLRLGLISLREVKKQDALNPALRRYFPHGLGHPLGLDVHDVIEPNVPIAEGWVMTVEPGIYIPEEGLGIRLEQDVLVGGVNNIVLTQDIPVEPDLIEEMMKGSTARKGPRPKR